MEKSKERCCYLCGEKGLLLHKGVRDNDSIDVLCCPKCSLVFLSDDSHIDNEFYENGAMIGEVKLQNWINNTLSDDTRRYESLRKHLSGLILTDFGCGNAGFLNFAKKDCKKVYGVELQKDLYNYFNVCGLEVHAHISQIPAKSDIITMFHVLEHIKDPVELLKNLKDKLNKNGKLFIEVPNSNDALIGFYNCESFKKFVFWGCHLYVYNEKTLRQIIEKAGYRIKKLQYIQRYTLMNHLYWLLKHKPGGHKIWARYDFKILNAIYRAMLKIFKITDTITVEIEDKGV